jgi:serine/threonine protein kinase
MTPDRWRQVDDLFNAALERPPQERITFLKETCADDLELRREVESLLKQHDPAAGFLETRADEPTQTLNIGALIGRQVGPYRIASLLGAGGMGEVYRAHDSKLGRDVALKALPTSVAGDRERLSRFQREARTLASLNHPNIGAIYGLEESGGATCLVLELVEGEILRGPIPIESALDYGGQVAEALKAAHQKGIVHRDLKPGNVKVTPEGRVKVLDFGLAKAILGDDDHDLSQLQTPDELQTIVGQIVGTPAYMSPEQARGRSVDTRTDIWAFGCLFYELLTGRRAFSGKTLPETIEAVLGREPDWNALPPRTPAKIRELLRRCLEKDHDRRLASVEDAARIIREVASPSRRLRPWQLALAIAVGLLTFVVAVLLIRRPAKVADRSEWVQITEFPDSVSQPALSPDGRLLSFVRGPGTFYSSGQIYVKMMPDGEPKQLTDDDLQKMSPVFSPDGSRIAYTTVHGSAFTWDTWLVPVLGGEPRLWLPNASGLVWTGSHGVLFSELLEGQHMSLVRAEQDRSGKRDVYVPASENGMAHRSYLSPDRKWVLTAEMNTGWLPCRLVPLDGSSSGSSVGPRSAGCTSAAWSPDGAWMYFTSSASGSFHIWRQRFPNGTPEQITSGPTEEEGIAMAPDGRSFVTAVGQKQRPLMLHAQGRDRQISLEGYAYQPKFTPDGKRLLYRILRGSQPRSDPTELWIADIDSGHAERLLSGVSLFGSGTYGVSDDSRRVVVSGRDPQGKDRLWIVPLDRGSPPYQVPGVEGDWATFGEAGQIFFRSSDGFAYRVREDGSDLTKVIDEPVQRIYGLSPDKDWLVEETHETLLYPLKGGSPLRFPGDIPLTWSRDGKYLYITWATVGMGAQSAGTTDVVPLPPGGILPEKSFRSEQDVLRLPGVRVIDAADVAPGPAVDVYAFSRETTQRNLFRIPIP